MKIESVFDGGVRVKVRDGIFMHFENRFVIMRYIPGEGWIEVRQASEAEIIAWKQMKSEAE